MKLDERTIETLGRALESGMGRQGKAFEALKQIAELQAESIRSLAFSQAGRDDFPPLDHYRALVTGQERFIEAVADVLHDFYELQKAK